LKYLSLKYKLLFFSIGLSIFLTVILSIIELNYDIRKYRNNLQEDLEYFEKVHQEYLSLKLWEMEYDSLSSFAKNEVGEKLISTVKISDTRDHIVAQASEKTSKERIERRFDLTYIHNNKKNEIGKVYISGNIPTFYEMLESRWEDLFVINGFFVTIIFFTSYLLFYRSVLRRLLNITRFTDEVSSFNKEGKSPIIPNDNYIPDEITRLVNSLNDRTNRINTEFHKRKEAELQIKVKNETLINEIQERTQVQSELKKSQETFLSVLDGIDATIYVSDIETYEVLFVNKYMIETFGEDMTGKKCWDVFRGEKEPCSQCTNGQILDENGKPSGVYVWQGKNPITHRWYINYDRAIRWHDGRPVRLQIGTDITDLKKMEEDLRQSHKMESVGTLAGGIAHDFNNILSIIIGNTELALEGMPDWNPAYNNIQEIKMASFRARDVVKQLLSYSRKNKEELKAVDMAPVLKESLKLVRSTLPASIEIRDNLPDSTETVLADTTQINQIIINLCTNAAHAMPDEKGIIEIFIEPVDAGRIEALKYNNAKPGKYLKLMIKDNGTGIDQENINKVFDPYFTTKEIGKGTGMGLSVVHGIVKSHNGYINIESDIIKGTTVYIYFPISSAKIFAKSIKGGMKNSVKAGHILFVDDEKQIAKLAKQTLSRLGYFVTTEIDPILALRKFKTAPDSFDLVISDMTMPQMSGAELTEKIKKIRKDIPIVICTGHSSLIDEKKSKELGISAFLMKPVSGTDLSKTIMRLVNKKKTI